MNIRYKLANISRKILKPLAGWPEECLMAGNDAEKDMVAGSVGMKTYLVTNYLVGVLPGNLNLRPSEWCA